jgi:hypothetical protein
MTRASWLGPVSVALLVLGGCGGPVSDVTARDGSDPSTTTVTQGPTTTSSSTTTTSSTTTSSTTTTTTLPTAATATGTAWHFEGQHRGIEHFRLQTERCPFLDHELQETYTLSDGTTWAVTEQYCGTIDAHGFWTGGGSFEITAGDGSLAGTFTSAAQLPSAGEPYQLDVHSGTGQFAGATGTCRLDNHLHPISFGVQEQSGAFVCDLAQ